MRGKREGTLLGSLLVAGLAAGLAPACGSSNHASGFTNMVDGGQGGGDATTLKDGGHKPLGDGNVGQLGNKDTGPGPETGTMGGVHGCDVSCQAAGGTCVGETCTIKENPGALTPAQEQALNAGGNADSSFAWTYPYDQTVFPRGLIPPTLQFAGEAPDAILVHITYSTMDYIGYYAAGPSGNPSSAKLSDGSWVAVTQGAAAGDVVKVAVTKLVGGQASGPITESWTIAQGNMRGQIYYETYGSSIIGGAGVGIMSLAPGGASPTPIAKGCGNVCHTASADGSTLVANAGNELTGTYISASTSYDLKNTPPSTLYASTSKSIFTYGGLYPDGTFAMSATNYRTWIPGKPSRLYDTKTGANIPAAGWDSTYKQGGATVFSPDGKLFAFNDNDSDDGEGHTLMLASFDVGTKTFSNFGQLTTDPSATLAWPNFTPDDASLVYHAGVGGPTDGGVGSGYETDMGATGNVYRIDVATKTPVRLDALDGYSPDGSSYLPDNDPNLSFVPTVLPEAVGGYFWVVFTSHRSYGNILPSQAGMDDDEGKLWVAAIDINATPGKDSSHPGFYLDGQEAGSDNLRGFWVLSPCQQTGTKCGAGDECCSGFCRPDGEGGAYSCIAAPVTGCSNEYEKCTSTAQCCGASAGYSCIGGFCSQPAPK